MQSILELVLSLSGFYIFIALGYLTTRITSKAKTINKKITLLLLYLLLPLLIINTFLTFSIELLNELGTIFILSVLVHIIGLVIIFLRFRILDLQQETKGALLLCTTFNNALFLPVPLVLIFIGDAGIPVVALYSITQMILSVTLGVTIGAYYGGSHSEWKNSIRKVLLFPPFIAALIGIFLLVIGFTFPPEVSSGISYVSNVTTYLALFVVGLSIGTAPSFMHILRPLEVILTRQFLVPTIIFFLLLFSGLSVISRNVLLIQALMPSAVIMVVYATEFGLDSESAATVVTLGTLILLPIVPFIPFLLN
jgi:predicted permease